MNSITLTDFETFVVVLFVIFGGIITVAKVLDIIKAWRKPAKDIESRLNSAEGRLANDHARLTALESSTTVLLKAEWAMIEHMKTGNGKEKLNEASELITDYLVSR